MWTYADRWMEKHFWNRPISHTQFIDQKPLSASWMRVGDTWQTHQNQLPGISVLWLTSQDSKFWVVHFKLCIYSWDLEGLKIWMVPEYPSLFLCNRHQSCQILLTLKEQTRQMFKYCDQKPPLPVSTSEPWDSWELVIIGEFWAIFFWCFGKGPAFFHWVCSTEMYPFKRLCW